MSTPPNGQFCFVSRSFVVLPSVSNSFTCAYSVHVTCIRHNHGVMCDDNGKQYEFGNLSECGWDVKEGLRFISSLQRISIIHPCCLHLCPWIPCTFADWWLAPVSGPTRRRPCWCSSSRNQASPDHHVPAPAPTLVIPSEIGRNAICDGRSDPHNLLQRPHVGVVGTVPVLLDRSPCKSRRR